MRRFLPVLGKTPTPELMARLSIAKHVRKDTPPLFLVATMADQSVPVENSLQLYKALRDADVPTEMHVYAQGAHGNSRDPQYGSTALWPLRAEEWLRFNGWLTKWQVRAGAGGAFSASAPSSPALLSLRHRTRACAPRAGRCPSPSRG